MKPVCRKKRLKLHQQKDCLVCVHTEFSSIYSDVINLISVYLCKRPHNMQLSRSLYMCMCSLFRAKLYLTFTSNHRLYCRLIWKQVQSNALS